MTTTYVAETRLMRPRFHWPSIVAGAFVAMALFVVSVVLARGCGVDMTFQQSTTAGAETVAIIWGGIAALICFGFGGLVAGMNAVEAGYRRTWMNGFMVWAVAVPLLIYFLGNGLGPRLGQGPELGGGKNIIQHATAIQASAEIAPTDQVAARSTETIAGTPSKHHEQGAAWWTLASLCLGFIGAASMSTTGASQELPMTPTT